MYTLKESKQVKDQEKPLGQPREEEKQTVQE